MTLKLQKKRARELAAKGFKLDVIAELVGASHRSVQRWLAKDKDSSVPDPIAITDDDVVTTDPGTVAIDPAKEQSESIQQKAIEMFLNGLKPDAIAKQLGIASRTIQRWLSSSNLPEESQKLVSAFPTELQSAFVSQAPNSSSWVEDVERALYEHQECHREIRRKLGEILHNQLNLPEPNFRAIHIASMALIRHTTAERESLNVEWLDINRAIMLIRAHGLGVVDFSELEALKRQRVETLPQ